ncbi:PREDICTED: bifunctional protein FolD 1, mitochondrial-like isoform X2 [Ipomoea nil]|uniref:bifunctional protein FolD 1, mitochondrial-like isoform X2 n=1 Tax=Ipomoea nil TaxID=35883 RepID=UPI0009019EF6|nr:PREDICTED: bifunctional protein FolD 1, mitochondrial-like isoform X2 [Ipomoea nil]
MRMAKRIVSGRAFLGQTWARTSILFPSLSRAMSTLGSSILKSPPLVSLDQHDEWSHGFSHPDNAPTQKCTDNKTVRIIDGKSIADEIRLGIAIEVSRMKESIGKVPSLAVILVGQRRDSLTYVRNKILACEEAGFRFSLDHLPENCTEEEICDKLSSFNDDPSIHGILVQLPLPQHLNKEKILNMLSLEKDVDGFHPLNMGNLAVQGKEPLFIPCTPKGCIELLLRSGVEIMGKKAVVIGRSNIVGLPMFLLLQRHHATVTIVHAFSNNPEIIAREADILIAAAGVPNLVRGSWLKPGAVVIDVGTTPIERVSMATG